MGTLTTVDGEISISPALNWKDIKDSKFLDVPDMVRSTDVVLRVREEEVEVDDGLLMQRTCDTLSPAWEGPYKAYHLVEHVQEVIDAFPGHTFTGRLECLTEGVEPWRVVISNRKAMKVEPKIVWPDEEAP